MKRINYMRQLENLPESVKNFIDMQINHLKKRKWEDPEKQFSFSLFYKSAKAYIHLRKEGFKFPCVGQIRRWVTELDLFPDKLDKLRKILLIRSATMNEKERESVLIWDEMSIETCLEYNSKKDVVEGFTDLGEKGRSRTKCNHVLVFMLRGRQCNWRQPVVSYLAANSVLGDDLVPIIFKILDFVESAGFKVRFAIWEVQTVEQFEF